MVWNGSFYPIISKVSYMSGGFAGFLKHQQKYPIEQVRSQQKVKMIWDWDPNHDVFPNNLQLWQFMGPGCYLTVLDLGVSENSGTPNSSILIGFSIINHPFWGTPILETSICQNRGTSTFQALLIFLATFFAPEPTELKDTS